MPIALKAKLFLLKKADGSCEISNGKSKVLCGVNGPGDIQSSKKKFDRLNVLFSINRLAWKKIRDNSKHGANNSSNKSMNWPSSSTLLIESVVDTAIDVDAYPRTALQVCAQEIKTDGAIDSLIFNGICLTLLDSGLRLCHVFAAVSVAKIKRLSGVDFVVEPTELDAVDADATFLFVFKPSLTETGGGALIASDSHGEFSIGDFKTALNSAQKECLGIFDFYRQMIFDKFAPSLIK